MKRNLYIVANFGEIVLKGKNISFFEKKLFESLNHKIKHLEQKYFFEKKSGGSFFIKLKDDIKSQEIDFILNAIKYTFGFSNYYLAYFLDNFSIESLENSILELLKDIDFSKKDIKTFAIKTKKVSENKNFSTQKVNTKMGSFVYKFLEKKNKKISVNLDNPDYIVNIKIMSYKVFVFSEIFKASGGLPTGSLGKNISLLSGGFDSPVASFLAQKRGLETYYIHFHSVPKTDKKSIQKVKEILSKLVKYQGWGKLFLIPIIDIQRDIVLNTERKYSIVLQRRAFLEIAEKVSEKFNLKTTSITTGDSLGQVASQTLENLIAVSEKINSKNIILRPLISYDKEEIIEIAKKIDTYDISKLPHEDACSLFVPEKPETKANLEKVLEEEKKLDKTILDKVLENIEIIDF